MVRFKVEGFGDEVLEAEAGSFTPYDGPLPPKNTLLRVKVKQLKLKLNKNGEPMLNCVAEVDMPKGHDAAKYNSCPAWWNGNVTKKSAGFVNEFLRSIAGSEAKGKALISDFWKKGMNLDGDGKPNKAGLLIKSIGTFKIDPDRPPTGYILSKIKTDFNDKNKKIMDIANWVLPKSAIEGPSVDDSGEEVEEVEEEDGVEVEQEEDGDLLADDDAGHDEEDQDSAEYSDEPPF